MGSSGTGSFSDYSEHTPKATGGKTGGGSGEDQCGRAFSTNLEDVSRCDYFLKHASVPPINTPVEIYFNKRLIAKTNKGEEIGYLPTRYNYIKLCLEDGYNYYGIVSASSSSPLTTVTIDIAPAK